MSTKQRMVIRSWSAGSENFPMLPKASANFRSRKGEKQNSVQPSIRRKMIAKAKATSYGINDLRYITGESKHKKHPEKIYRVLDNLLPPEMDAMGIWNSMQLTLSQHRPIKNSIIRIELSPSHEHIFFIALRTVKSPLPEEACRSGQYFSKPSAGTCSKTDSRYGLYSLSFRLGVLHAFFPLRNGTAFLYPGAGT